MKVVVTGATGLIGSEIVQRYMEMQDVNVVAFGHSKNKLEEIFAKYLGKNNFQIVSFDFSYDFDFLSLANSKFNEPMDLVFHAASPMSPSAISERPVDIIKPNVSATLNIFDAICEQKKNTGVSAKIVVFSSVTVYGYSVGREKSFSENETAQADVLDNWRNPYSENKRMTEVIAHSYIRQHGVDAIIVRPSTVYGYSHFMPDTALYSFIKNVLQNEDIILNSSGLAKRDNIYLSDAVDAMIKVTRDGVCGEAYNISSNGDLGNYMAVDEIAETISKIANDKFHKRINVLYKEKKLVSARPFGIKLDNSKLKKLGWEPQFSFENGIEEALRKYFRDK